MAEFAYNNAKNASTGHTSSKLNYSYYLCIFLEEDTNLCFWGKLADKLLVELQDLINFYQKNFYHAQELQKQAHNKDVKPSSYTFSDKVWLNSKYNKTK